MKKLLPLVTALMLAAPGPGGIGLLFAQETPSPATSDPNQRLELMPSEMPASSRSGAAAQASQPEKAPAKARALETPSDVAAEKKNKTEAAADEMQLRLRMRQAKTRALRDSAVQAQWDSAHAARTDQAKRQAMRNYYQLLYAQMAKIDSSLKAKITLERDALLKRVDQHLSGPSDTSGDIGSH